MSQVFHINAVRIPLPQGGGALVLSSWGWNLGRRLLTLPLDLLLQSLRALQGPFEREASRIELGESLSESCKQEFCRMVASRPVQHPVHLELPVRIKGECVWQPFCLSKGTLKKFGGYLENHAGRMDHIAVSHAPSKTQHEA